MSRAIPLSVIVVWRDVREGLVEALRTLAGPVEAVGGELIVVSDLADGAIGPVREAFPGLCWVRVEPPLTEPRAWEAGARAARGETAAFAQARCRYDPGWAAAILDARAAGTQAVAGPVAPEAGA